MLCLLSANLVASQFFSPEIFAGYDSRELLQPLNGELENKVSSDGVHVIRALLGVRQSGCPTGYAGCTNRSGRLALQFALFFTSLVAFCSVWLWPFVCRALDVGMLNSHSCCPTGDTCCESDGELTRDLFYPAEFLTFVRYG